MKITEEDTKEAINEIAGAEAVSVYDVLKNKENVDEFYIAKKLNIPINQIRNILYKFESYNLIISTRKKDKQKGWYIYFFTFDKRQADEVVLQLKKERISRFQQKLEREKKHEYYLCPERCTRVSIENAMENGFMCLECGQLLGPDPNTDRTIKRMEKEIDDLSKTVADLEEQRKKDLEIIKEKQLKKEAKKQPKKKVQQKPKNKPKPVKKVKHSKKSKKKKR